MDTAEFSFVRLQPLALNWNDEHRHCCANPSWKDRLSEAQRQPPARLNKAASSRITIIKENAGLASAAEEAATMGEGGGRQVWQ
jgi:hypothetical protein